MREFPRNAVMERKMLTAEKEIDCCCCNPTKKEGEHRNTLCLRLCSTLCIICRRNHCAALKTVLILSLLFFGTAGNTG